MVCRWKFHYSDPPDTRKWKESLVSKQEWRGGNSCRAAFSQGVSCQPEVPNIEYQARYPKLSKSHTALEEAGAHEEKVWPWRHENCIVLE